MKKITILFSCIFSFLLLMLISPVGSKADGMIMPPPDYYMRETSQKAVIVHEKGVETMILQVSFEGDAKDFAWIVPTPSKPKVTESSDTLFTAIQELATPDYYARSYYGSVTPSLMSAEDSKSTVAVVETKRVGIFKIEVLASNDADYLAKWLEEHNYQYPSKQSYILDSYIKNGWYFTAIKVDSSLAKESSVNSTLKSGHATPLKFEFKSEKIVFPLKISSVVADKISTIINNNAANNSSESGSSIQAVPNNYPIYIQSAPINLYVISDHKLTHPKFNTEYARWVKKLEIQNLAQDDQGNPWFEPVARKMYLTKLSAYMQFSDMTEDVYFTQAADNNPIGVDYVLWWVAILVIICSAILFIISPFGFLFIISAIVYHFTNRSVWKSVAVITEIFMMILITISTLLLSLFYASQMAVGYGAPTVSYVWFFIVGAVIIVALMIIWRILESINNKRLSANK